MNDYPESEDRQRRALMRTPVDEARIAQEREALNAILAAVARHDRTAFATLYRRSSARIFSVILRVVNDRVEAEDLLQDVYINVWRRAAAFDPARGTAMTWLISLARNRAIDRLRERRELALDDADALAIASDEPTPIRLAEASEERRRLEDCLQRLEPQHRNAVREAFFGGLAYSELARRLNVPLGTMKSWIRRSLMQLKGCLEP
ncbi:RNA polymerase subunit sigma-24 [Pandoraea faecigallinarum]|uniref:RNA polymerase subunit sigma-24 n=1 Tax=Pandoraea faecigallinarum TaxID=656179 RepID=A0A0H3WZK8_9BURK|nr:RNA polymerase subunit sigma-24 [Pandoraea faecigallinarum]